MKIYIYYNADEGDLEVFHSLEEAKAFADSHWVDVPEEPWVEDDTHIDYIYRPDYERIYVREV